MILLWKIIILILKSEEAWLFERVLQSCGLTVIEQRSLY
jgi:hypothetical protein